MALFVWGEGVMVGNRLESRLCLKEEESEEGSSSIYKKLGI